MKKFLVVLMLPILLALGLGRGSSLAQTARIEIGSASATATTNQFPFNTFYKYSYNQMIYEASEVGRSGYIGAIVFKYAGTKSHTLDELTIWMSHSSFSSISANSWVPQDSLKQVFHATDYVIPTEAGDLTIVLDSSFYYDGTRDLTICISQSSSSYSGNTKFIYTTKSPSRCIRKGNDDDPSFANHPGTQSGSTSGERPNIGIIMNNVDAFCLPVAGLKVTNVTENEIDITWKSGSSSELYEVAILDTATNGTNLDNATHITPAGSTHVFSNLTPNTSYLVGIRKVCGENNYSGWSSMYVRTSSIPTVLPFVCDFEDTYDREQWFLDNGQCVNHWICNNYNDAESELNYGMYITNNDNTKLNQYTTRNAVSTVFAKVLLQFDEACEYNIKYDWLCNGESAADYLRVMLVPASMYDKITASTSKNYDFTSTKVPQGVVAIDGGHKLNLAHEWMHYMGVADIPTAGNYYLTFMWANDNSDGVNPPAAIDNIFIKKATCQGVDSVKITNITTTDATIAAYSASGSNFRLYYRVMGVPNYDSVDFSSTYTLTDLLAGTAYEIQVRTDCGGDDMSFESVDTIFTTKCEDIETPWTYGAEGEFQKYTTGSGYYPYCWNYFEDGNSSTYWGKTTTSSEIHSGSQAIKYVGQTWGSSNINDWLITPNIFFTGHDEMTIWVKVKSRSWGTSHAAFAIYASDESIIDIADTSHYDRLTVTGMNATSKNIIVNNKVDITNTTWQQFTIQLPSTLSDYHHLAFVVDDKSSEFHIDDIYIYPVSSCAKPSNVKITETTSSSVTLAWECEASSVDVYYGAPGTTIENAEVITVTDTTATISGLNPNTEYEYILVATCSDGVESNATFPVRFKTACAPIASTDLPFTENFSDNQTGISSRVDDCWYQGTNATQNYPHIVIKGKGGEGRTNSLEFDATRTEYSYAAMPMFETPINELVLTCSIYRPKATYSYNYSGSLSIGVMSNPNDINTFTPYDTLVPGAQDSWTDFQVSLSGVDVTAGSYIAFVMPKGTENRGNLDDIIIQQNSTCDCPTDLTVDAVSATTADVSWTDNEGFGWAIYYGLPGFDPDTVTNPISVADETSGTITGLSPQTTYEFFVVTDCFDGNFSINSIRQQFTTTCAAINTLPYTENFEAYENSSSAPIDPCWVKNSVGSVVKPYPIPSSNAKVNGLRGLYFSTEKSSSSNFYCYTALPMFEEALTHLQIKFNMKNKLSSYGVSYSKLAIGVMSNPNDITTFDTVMICDMSELPNATVKVQECLFDTYTGTGKYIALMCVDVDRPDYGTVRNEFYIDDIEVAKIPTCRRISHITATTTATTADLSWEGTAQKYEIKYSLNENMSDSNVITSLSNQVQLSNLTNYTNYHVDVRAICGADTSEWMLYPIIVKTKMDCGEGYKHVFDTIGEGTSSSPNYVINASTYQHHTRVWSIYTAAELKSMGLMSNDNKIHSISLHTTTVGSPIPFKIYMAETNADVFTNNLADTLGLSQMTLVCDSTLQFVADSWNEIFFNTPFTYSGDANLMIAFSRDAELDIATKFSYTDAGVDRSAHAEIANYDGSHMSDIRGDRANIIFNMCADVPSCVRPLELAQTAISANSFSLSWTGTASQYQVVYDTKDFNPNQMTNQSALIVNTNAATVTGVAPAKQYHIYVRSICGNDSSLWSEPLVVTTECGIFPLPYVENFDTYPIIEGTQTMNKCWTLKTNIANGVYPAVSDLYSVSAPHCLQFYGTMTEYSYAALPEFSKPVNELTMTFKLYKASPDFGTIYVGVMTDPNNKATFQHLATFKPQIEGVWETFEYAFSDYDGEGKYITFLVPDSNMYTYSNMDDLEVFETPQCQSPTDVVVDAEGITSNSAIVSWTDRALNPANGYELEYGPLGFVLGNGTRVTSTTNPTTLTNLQPSTQYDVYVRAMCGANNAGKWSVKVTFTTLCLPTTLPVTYDFEEFNRDEVPICFHHYNDATSDTYSQYPFIGSIAFDAHDSHKYLYFSVGTAEGHSYNQAMIFPAIDTDNYPMNNNQVVFWGKCGITLSSITVGVMSDPTNFATFTPIDTIQLTKFYSEYTVSFSEYEGTGAYPAFVAYRPVSGSASVYIDDVTVEEVPTCPRAEELKVLGSTDHTATVAWTDANTVSNWLISYGKTTDSTDAHTVVANSNPYTLTGLDAHSQYHFNVRPICAVGDTAIAATEDVVFNTTQTPAALPYAYNFENATEWNNWQTNTSDTTVNWYRGTADAGQGTHAMYISNDHGTTNATDWEAYISAAAYRDINFGTDTATFELSFKANVGGVLDETSDEPSALAVMLVDPTKDVVANEDGYTSPWGDIDTLAVQIIRLDTNWNTYTVVLDSLAGVKRLAFFWYNDISGVFGYEITPQACAIDNIIVKERTCLTPTQLTVSAIETSSATLSWEGAATQYQLAYHVDSIDSNSYVIVNGNTHTLTDLSVDTKYQFQVRAICTVGDTSLWSEIKTFRTICNRYSATDTIREDFTHVTPALYSNKGNVPNCWNVYNNGTKGVTPHVVGSGSYWYAHDTNSLCFVAGGSNYGTVAVAQLPYTIEPVNSLTLSYWVCTESANTGTLEVGYLTGIDLATDFVSVKAISASEQTHHSGNGNQGPTVGLWDTVTFTNVPANALALAFRWNVNASYSYVACVDDVVVTTNIRCNAPVVTEIVKDDESATISWNGSADNYQIMMKEASANVWGDTITTTDTAYTYHDLMPTTDYQVQIRALCGGIYGNSDWVVANFTTDSLNCTVPTHLAVSDIDYDHATLSWDSSSVATQWVINIFNQTSNIMDTVDTNPTVISHLYNGTEYQVAVKSLCRASIYSDWSDTITFITLSCLPVTDVQVTDIAANSAKVSWTAAEGQTEWEVMYGEAGFGHGEEIVESVTDTQFIISGLEEETSYDVYVRAKCGEGIYGAWSAKQTFTTTLVPVCDSVTNVQATEITHLSAVITWAVGAGATAWEVSYGPQGTTVEEGTKVEVNEASCNLTGLSAETSYDVYVRSICGEDFYSDWSTVVTFTTEAMPTCDSVSNVTVANITENAATVTWTAVEGQSSWELSYGVAGTTAENGVIMTTATTTQTLENLQPETEYGVYVRAVCDDNLKSEWSHVTTFTTLEGTVEDIDGVEGNFHFAIYPNPTHNATTISLSGVEGKVMISVVDMNGRTVANESIECGSDCEKRLDVAHLAQGTYFVRILGNDINSVRKLIVR